MVDFSTTPVTVLLTCSVFQKEVQALALLHYPDCTVRHLNSMLHIQPERLENRLAGLLKEALVQQHRVILVYGDCCAGMTELQNIPGVARVSGHNCCELVLGREVYRCLEHEGVFFLLPEWARRWRTIFTHKLGLNQDNAASLMQDMHTRLVYLDFGLEPVPVSELQACAQYVGLPYEVMPLALENLKGSIDAAMLRLHQTGAKI